MTMMKEGKDRAVSWVHGLRAVGSGGGTGKYNVGTEVTNGCYIQYKWNGGLIKDCGSQNLSLTPDIPIIPAVSPLSVSFYRRI